MKDQYNKLLSLLAEYGISVRRKPLMWYYYKLVCLSIIKFSKIDNHFWWDLYFKQLGYMAKLGYNYHGEKIKKYTEDPFCKWWKLDS